MGDELEMRRILIRMSLLQYGRTQAFDATGGKSENPDPRPSGATREHFEYGFGKALTLAEHWAWRWEGSPTQSTVDGAKAALLAWTKRSAPTETDGSAFEDWVVDDGEGYAVAQVAGKFGIAEARVRRIRLKASRDTEFGLPLQFAPAPKLSDSERIKALAARGCTERQIAFQVGVGKTTVRRALGKAA